MELLSTNEIKEIQISILNRFAKYCDENGFEYFLYAGTLIGAVRHKGFIPWDDDIDVAMDRATYEKFYELTKIKPIDKDLEIVFYRTSKTSNSPYIKIVDKTTEGQETLMRDEIHTGVFIDVFPIDYLPNRNEDRTKQEKKMKILNRRLSLSSRKLIPCLNPLKMAKRLFIYLCYHHFDYNAIAKQADELCLKYPNNAEDENGLVGLLYYNVIYDRSILDGTIMMPFENGEYKVPKYYHEYLTSQYGDYMTPPPPHLQVGLHYLKAWRK